MVNVLKQLCGRNVCMNACYKKLVHVGIHMYMYWPPHSFICSDMHCFTSHIQAAMFPQMCWVCADPRTLIWVSFRSLYYLPPQKFVPGMNPAPLHSLAQYHSDSSSLLCIIWIIVADFISWSSYILYNIFVWYCYNCDNPFTSTAQEKKDQWPSLNPRPTLFWGASATQATGPSCKSFISHCLMYQGLSSVAGPFSPEQCLQRGYHNVSTCSQRTWTSIVTRLFYYIT